MDQKKRTVILGLVFLALLAFAYVENTSFFGSVGNVFLNPPLAVLFVFVHNVLVVSLILLGMTFYVGLVLNFFPQRKIEYVVLHNPRVFAFVFTLMIIFISILSKHASLWSGCLEHVGFCHSFEYSKCYHRRVWNIQNYRKDTCKKDDHESPRGDLLDFLCGCGYRSWLCASFEGSSLKRKVDDCDVIPFLV